MTTIEFEGEISQESKNYINKQIDKGYRAIWVILPIMAYLVIIPVFVADIQMGILVSVVLLIAVIIMSFCPRIHYNQKMIEDYYPISVVVEDDKLITDGKGEDAYNSRRIDEVKVVIDGGDFYYIKYYYPFYDYTLCQKDLIVKGTIEEFEELFADRLVRKIRKTK